MVKMNGLCPPLTNVNVLARVVDTSAKATSAFVLDNYNIFLHLLVSFYIVVRNSGTIWAPKCQKIV